MAKQKIKVQITPAGYGSQVWVDGKPINGVRMVQVEATTKGTIVRLELSGDVEIVGPPEATAPAVIPTLPEDTIR